MSSEPSFEAACRTLEDMFPDLDPIVVRSVLDAKDGNVNEATTKLLAMSRSKRGNGGGMSSSSGGGGGGGYGDAPRSESMANGGEEINPYTKDARYDDARALRANAFSCAIVVVVVINAHREHKRGVCALDHHHHHLCACDRCKKTRDQGTTRPRIQGKMHVTASQKMCLAGIRDHRARSNAFEAVLAPMLCVRLDGLMRSLLGGLNRALCGRKRARALIFTTDRRRPPTTTDQIYNLRFEKPQA